MSATLRIGTILLWLKKGGGQSKKNPWNQHARDGQKKPREGEKTCFGVRLLSWRKKKRERRWVEIAPQHHESKTVHKLQEGLVRNRFPLIFFETGNKKDTCQAQQGPKTLGAK